MKYSSSFEGSRARRWHRFRNTRFLQQPGTGARVNITPCHFSICSILLGIFILLSFADGKAYPLNRFHCLWKFNGGNILAKVKWAVFCSYNREDCAVNVGHSVEWRKFPVCESSTPQETKVCSCTGNLMDFAELNYLVIRMENRYKWYCRE